MSETLYQKAQRLNSQYQTRKRNQTNRNYESLVESVSKKIEKMAEQGQPYIEFSPLKYEITIWDAIPRLLKDERFNKFKIEPKKPDMDDKDIRISWYK